MIVCSCVAAQIARVLVAKVLVSMLTLRAASNATFVSDNGMHELLQPDLPNGCLTAMQPFRLAEGNSYNVYLVLLACQKSGPFQCNFVGSGCGMRWLLPRHLPDDKNSQVSPANARFRPRRQHILTL